MVTLLDQAQWTSRQATAAAVATTGLDAPGLWIARRGRPSDRDGCNPAGSAADQTRPCGKWESEPSLRLTISQGRLADHR